jgi:hypothetical protein
LKQEHSHLEFDLYHENLAYPRQVLYSEDSIILVIISEKEEKLTSSSASKTSSLLPTASDWPKVLASQGCGASELKGGSSSAADTSIFRRFCWPGFVRLFQLDEMLAHFDGRVQYAQIRDHLGTWGNNNVADVT